MLGWVMRRGVDNGSTAPRVVVEGDTTQIDQPDTPAPVFAARAIKSALFGTPARPNDDTLAVDMAGETKPDMIDDDPTMTPPRLAGILLTPGTGTSRRKRVSFGHDVVDRAGRPINKSSRDASGDLTAKDGKATRKRTKLTEALEKSRRNKSQNVVPAPNTAASDKADMATEEWVEEDEGGDDDHCTHDITLDLNEPHSRSGKYWKSNFEQYHQDAKIEMEKLLKYKQLAKSYAKMKDAEALDLQEKLKEEQQRVSKMERGIQELKAHVKSKGDAKDSLELKKHLAKQTDLAEQYKAQVEELEAMLQDHPVESTGRRGRLAASPRTQKTLLETKRELRKAREQVREIGELRDEISHLKIDLSSAQQRISKLTEENKKLARDCDNVSDARVFKAQLKDAKEETRRKDDELRRLAEEFASFKSEMQAREEESKQALSKAQDKIAELKKEVSTLQTSSIVRRRPISHPNSRTAEPIFDDTMSDIEPRLKARARDDKISRELNRQSIDGADLALEAGRRNTENAKARPTLREKYREEPNIKPSDLLQELGIAGTDILVERTNSDRPQQQPSWARTTKASESLKQGPQRRVHSSSDALLGTRARATRDAIDLNTMEESRPLSTRTRSAVARSSEVNQVRERFGRLGGTDVDSSAAMSANTSRSVLPPDRLAAAMARIEQRKQQRKRAHMSVSDKENVHP